MDRVDSMLTAFIAGIAVSLFTFLITLKSYEKEITDLKVREKETNIDEAKKEARKAIFSFEKKSVRNFYIRAFSLIILITLTSLIILLNNSKGLMQDGLIFESDFYFVCNLMMEHLVWCVIGAVFVFQLIFIIWKAKSKLEKTIPGCILLFVLFLILGQIIYWNALDANYSVQSLDKAVLHVDNMVVINDVEISWDEVEGAQRYHVVVNDKPLIRTTHETSYNVSNDLNPNEENEVVIIADSFGRKSVSDALHFFALPKIESISIIGDVSVGNELSFEFLGNDITKDNMALYYDNITCSWFRDREEIEGAQNRTYKLTPEDYNRNISVLINIENKSIKSNMVKPVLGEYSPPTINISSYQDEIRIDYDTVEGVEWYDIYLNEELYATTRNNSVVLRRNHSDSQNMLYLVLRGYGYEEFKSHVYIIDSSE